MNKPEHLIMPETLQSRFSKMEGNALNFDEFGFDCEDDPIHIYRIMHIETFLEILNKKRLFLRNPAKWDDPFENYILNKCSNLRKLHFPADIYGQCWTLHSETDAMWRIYAPDKNGIKIKTTAQKLFSQLYLSEEAGEYPYLSCFIGKVRYVNSNEIRNLDERIAEIVSGPGASRNIPVAKTLLMKRPEFEHEAEVRLIYLDQHDLKEPKMGAGLRALLKSHDDAAFEFAIDPINLIDEIVFDPRMNDYSCQAYENYIRALGYDGPLHQSSLYKVE